jgi:hypothetical protein
MVPREKADVPLPGSVLGPERRGVTLATTRYRFVDRRRSLINCPASGFEVMTMKKSTLFVTFGAAALMNVACASSKPAEKPAEQPAAEAAPAADAAAPAAAPAEGGEAKPAEGSCGGAPKN